MSALNTGNTHKEIKKSTHSNFLNADMTLELCGGVDESRPEEGAVLSARGMMEEETELLSSDDMLLGFPNFICLLLESKM